MTTAPDVSALAALDAADPLEAVRREFALPEGVLYLDGNSLGPPTAATERHLLRVLREEWGGMLVSAWNDAGWVDAPLRLGRRIARLVGAGEDECVVTDSTSVNVFKLLAAALALRPGRPRIVMVAGDFPTDQYMAQGLASLTGARLDAVAAGDLAAALGDDVAVLCATHVDYRSGAMLDMAGLTQAAHEAGALAMWDLAHSAGAMRLDLAGCDVDLAVGCGYKYLNGGPGAPAFAMVARRHQEQLRQPLSGWLGHADPFAFEPGYRPAPGIRRLVCGTPPMLAMAALEAGLEVFDRVDLDLLRSVSLELTDLFITLVDERCAGLGVEVVTPREHGRRGSQVAVRHPSGFAVCRALIARGVVGDFRAPDILRLGVAPLVVRRVDVAAAVEQLREVLVHEEWRRPEFSVRATVT